EDDLGAECGCAFSLDGRGRGRHNDGGGDAELPRGECDGLGVVPGGVRDDAPPPVVVGESGDEVVRAADLECPGALEILALETDLRPDLLREPRRRQERCPDGDRLDGPGRIFDGPGLNETAHASPASSLKVEGAPPASSPKAGGAPPAGAIDPSPSAASDRAAAEPDPVSPDLAPFSTPLSSGTKRATSTTESPSSSAMSRTPWVARPITRISWTLWRLTTPFRVMSMSSSFGRTSLIATTFPVRGVIFRLITPFPPLRWSR